MGDSLHRSARIAIRATRAQRRRLYGLLRSAGDVRALVIDCNRQLREWKLPPVVSYQALCREIAGMSFGELDTVGARSVIRRYSTEWFEAAKRRKAGQPAGFPRRKKALLPVRWYHGTFCIDGDGLRIPVRRGAPPLVVRLARALPYPQDSIRSVTLLAEAGRLYVDVTAALEPEDHDLDPGIVAGVDPASSIPSPWWRQVRPCSCRGGRCGPSATCTSTTPRPGQGGWVPRPRAGASGGRGAGAGFVGPSAAGRPATAGASARDTTRRRRRSSPGRSTTGWAPLSWATPRGSATATPAGARTCGFATGGAPI